MTFLTKTIFNSNEDWVQPVAQTFTESKDTQRVKKREVDIDWKFIQTLEGFELEGYVPKETNERTNKVVSGVTVGSGFDLGQHSLAEIKELNFNKRLHDKLVPYVALRGLKAKNKLKEQPLKLTLKQATELDKKVKGSKVEQAAELFNKHSNLDFYDLPRPVQTIIMSVSFQYGALNKRTPNFWRVITNGDWTKAVWHLEHFGDSFKTRRRKEAALLKEHLTNIA